MASTSTNKQPLLVDNVLHKVVNLDFAYNNGLDITGTNQAELLVDAISSDGAIAEDIYVISRSATAYTVHLYLSTARDYLRPNESVYVGKLKAATTVGDVVHWDEMPRSLTPVPQVGDDPFNHAFYIPKGRALWAARDGTANVIDAPLIGVQGGFF